MLDPGQMSPFPVDPPRLPKVSMVYPCLLEGWEEEGESKNSWLWNGGGVDSLTNIESSCIVRTGKEKPKCVPVTRPFHTSASFGSLKLNPLTFYLDGMSNRQILLVSLSPIHSLPRKSAGLMRGGCKGRVVCT